MKLCPECGQLSVVPGNGRGYYSEDRVYALVVDSKGTMLRLHIARWGKCSECGWEGIWHWAETELTSRSDKYFEPYLVQLFDADSNDPSSWPVIKVVEKDE